MEIILLIYFILFINFSEEHPIFQRFEFSHNYFMVQALKG